MEFNVQVLDAIVKSLMNSDLLQYSNVIALPMSAAGGLYKTVDFTRDTDASLCFTKFPEQW